MAVNIKEISGNRLEVNNKLVIKNKDNQWVCPGGNLTPAEEKALYEHIRSIELDLERRKN